jgi:hypothetical protein
VETNNKQYYVETKTESGRDTKEANYMVQMPHNPMMLGCIVCANILVTSETRQRMGVANTGRSLGPIRLALLIRMGMEGEREG